MFELAWRDEVLHLSPERAIYWPAQKTLLVADTHFGKSAAFRQAGIALPHGLTAANLRRLSALVDATRAERMIVLGDLLHSRGGRAEKTMDEIGRWRAECQNLEIVLIRGNHDQQAGDPPEEWRIACHDKLLVGPFALKHHPVATGAGYVLAGHVHPAVTMRDATAATLTLPCFWFGPEVAVLPAFGEFTGIKSIRPGSKDRVFAAGPGAVVEVTTRVPSPQRRTGKRNPRTAAGQPTTVRGKSSA